MTTTATDSVAGPIWVCDPSTVTCVNDHPLLFHKSDYRGTLKLLGHAFLKCETCHPVSRFFALFIKHPSPIVVCYLLARESYDEWEPETAEDPPTQELLYHLRDPQGRSYNPTWRPPR